jgi:hypothetical protein
VTLGDDDPIWYASYGSNCLWARFNAYLTGGQTEGATRPEAGARDQRPPARSEAFVFPGTVRFLGDSAKWGGGGVAFLDNETPGAAPGRRYLITKGQFDDVAAQESRRAGQAIALDDLIPGTVKAIGTGFYDGILALTPEDGIPVVTFTAPGAISQRPTNPPSAAYLGTILRGLLEVHTAPVDQLADALLAAPGVAKGWSAAEIASLATK